MTKQNEMPEQIWAMSDRFQKTEKGIWDTVEDDPNFSNLPYSKYLRADTVVSREQYDTLLAVAKQMEGVLVLAHSVFKRYEFLHRQKNTQEEDAKAVTNKQHASDCVKAIRAFEQLEKEGA